MYSHDPLTERIIGCAIAVHRVLGPGLVEATYEEALCIELAEKGRCAPAAED
jgi:GxxExxY protein